MKINHKKLKKKKAFKWKKKNVLKEQKLWGEKNKVDKISEVRVDIMRRAIKTI